VRLDLLSIPEPTADGVYKAFGRDYNFWRAGAEAFQVVSRRCVMRGSLFMLAILMVAPVLAQSPKTKTHQTITGCLTSTGSSHEY
jgi:hypothetical protein